jgi:hypothetical protein
MCLVLFPWRRVYKNYVIINIYGNMILFFSFFFIFYTILTF